jgi:predicted transcriptional regulator of viral defense system
MASDSPLEFILQNPVFRLKDFQAAYRGMRRSDENAHEVLRHHVKQGRIISIRRGLYVHARFVDPWLLASKLADPCIISHDGALSFHKMTGLGHSITLMTTARTTGTQYDEVIYQPLRVSEERFSWCRAEEVEREGHTILISPLGDALVDCLALLEHAPPPVELMEVFQKARGLADPSAMIDHALRYGSPLLCSRLGFFFSCSRFDLEPGERARLERACSKTPTHFQRGLRTKQDGYAPLWKLHVPPDLFKFWVESA